MTILFEKALPDRRAAYEDMRKSYRNRLRNVNVSELSLVDKGANPGARVVLFKRDPAAEEFPEVLETQAEVREKKRDNKLAKQLKKLRKAVEQATVPAAAMSAEHTAYMAQMPEEKRDGFAAMSASERDDHMANNPIKKFTGEALERFGKFAVAIVDKQIDLQIAISKRAGESDVQAYNRALSENPALYTAYEAAKRSAAPDPFLCA